MVKFIKNWLEENNIKFTQEQKFEGCKRKTYLPFDIYIEDMNLIIEYDGRQHFKTYTNSFITEERLKYNKENDYIKNKWAFEHQISLLRIPYTLDETEVEEILNSIVEGNIKEIARKYKLYYINENEWEILNEKEYYINIDENYFNE